MAMKKIYLDTLSFDEIVKCLKNGEEIKADYNGKEFNFVYDSISLPAHIKINKLGVVQINNFFSRAYFEREENLIIETGMYMTRDRQYAYISTIDDSIAYGVIKGDKNIHCWDLEGCYQCNKTQSANDIVSKSI